jgi:hypothetical protein
MLTNTYGTSVADSRPSSETYVAQMGICQVGCWWFLQA